jgi:hypothetical protein
MGENSPNLVTLMPGVDGSERPRQEI